jgi:hypothetical protein
MEAAVAYFETLYRNLPGGIEKTFTTLLTVTGL